MEVIPIHTANLKMMKNEITLVPVGGLGNRIRAIESAICLAKECKSNLKIIWFKDWGMGARFDQLFCPFNIDGVEVKDASILDLLLYDRPRKRNFYMTFPFLKIIFDYCRFEQEKGFLDYDWVKNKKVYIASCYAVYPKQDVDYYNLFIPIKKIRAKIEEESRKFPPNILGVQIRRVDHVCAIKSSPVDLFIQKMKENVGSSFFVASDSIEEKNILKDIFQDKLLTVTDTLERGTVEGIQHALVEMCLLSKTKKIFGSKKSTFGEVAARLGHTEYEQVKKK